jgi:hypothetical protein
MRRQYLNIPAVHVLNLCLYPAAVGADLLLANYEQESSSPESSGRSCNSKKSKTEVATSFAGEQQRAEKELGYLYNEIHTWAYLNFKNTPEFVTEFCTNNVD